MNQNDKLAKALARHRDAKRVIPRLQQELARAEAEDRNAADDLIRVVKSLGKVGRQLVFDGEIYCVDEVDLNAADCGEGKPTIMLECYPSNVEWIDGPEE